MRRGPTRPLDIAAFGSALVAAAYTFAVIRIAWRESYFRGDDVVDFWIARTTPLRVLLRTPIDVHLVPLHQLVSYVVERVAPMNFSVGLTLLFLFHAAGLVTLYRVLELLRPSPGNVVLVAIYGLHVGIGFLFMWWTAALHRLPYIWLSILATLFYLKYRTTGSRRALVLLFVSTVLAYGFFSKAILIPVHLFFVEMALSVVAPLPGRARRFVTLAALAVPSVAYVLAWRAVTKDPVHALSHDVGFAARLAARGLEAFAQTGLGFWLDARPVVRISSALVWSAGIVYSVVRSPKTIVAWVGLVAVVAANWVMIALDARRAGALGFGLLVVDRYYFEIAFSAVVFVAIVILGVQSEQGETFALPPRARWIASIALLTAVAALGARSYATFTRVLAWAHLDHSAWQFMKNLEKTLAELPPSKKRPLELVDGPVPLAIVRTGEFVRHHSELVTLMGVSVEASPEGRYRISPDGSVVRVSR